MIRSENPLAHAFLGHFKNEALISLLKQNLFLILWENESGIISDFVWIPICTVYDVKLNFLLSKTLGANLESFYISCCHPIPVPSSYFLYAFSVTITVYLYCYSNLENSKMSTNKLDNQPVDSLSSWNPSVAGSDVSGEERSIGVSYSETGESGLPQVLNQHNYLETHRSGHLFPKDSSLPRRPHSPYNSNGPIKNLNIEMSYLRHGPPPPSDVDPQFDDRPFTVDREEKNKSAHKYRRKKPILLSILKCIVSLIMSAGLITCVIVSKLSLVTVGQKLNFTLWKSNNENNRTSNASIKASTLSINNASNQYQSAIVFNMLVLILIVPHAYGFLRSLFSSGFKQSHPWPTKRAVLWVRIIFHLFFFS